MYVSLASGEGLWYVDRRMAPARADVLLRYIQTYLEPALGAFPELAGKLHLCLRSVGFYFRDAPEYQIDVNAKLVDALPLARLRFLTGYMLGYFSLQLRGFRQAVPGRGERYYDKCAAFLAFSRGFAGDWLQALLGGCKKEFCDFREKYYPFTCREILPVPCRALECPPAGRLAQALCAAAAQADFCGEVDFGRLIAQAWARCGDTDSGGAAL